MPPIALPALLAALAQDATGATGATGATDAARPESGAVLPVIVGVVVLGLLLGVLRFLYLRARGPRGRGG